MTPNVERIHPAMSYARPAVASILRRCPDDVDDVLQDAAVRALRFLDTYRGDRGCAFETWFTRIAIRSALMHLRRERRWDAEVVMEPDQAHQVLDRMEWNGPSPEQLAEQAERRRILCAVLDQMPRKRRRAGYAMLEGAADDGSSASKAMRFHVRARLREVLPTMGVESAV